TAGLALAPGLKALGEELPSGPMKRVLGGVAWELDLGHSLDEAVAAQRGRVPEHLRGLVLAGVRAGRLGGGRGRYVPYERVGADLKRRIWINLAYPLMLLTCLALALIIVSQVVVRVYESIFRDFGIDLPWITKALVRVSHMVSESGWALVIAPAVLIAVT